MTKTKNILILILSLSLSLFFIYKGLTKHWMNPCKVYPADTIVPVDYINVINAFCNSGFLKMVAVIQILSGLLLIIPKARMLGAFLLLPVIVSIFSIHLFLDNRPGELVESGIPLLANLVLIVLLIEKWKKNQA